MRFVGGDAPGGRGAGRPGTRLGWLAFGVIGVKPAGGGMLRGIGGGARGFSKLVSWFEGKRGLAGGLVTVEICDWA